MKFLTIINTISESRLDTKRRRKDKLKWNIVAVDRPNKAIGLRSQLDATMYVNS